MVGLKFARVSTWQKFAFATPTFARMCTKNAHLLEQVLAECYLIHIVPAL